MLAKSSHFNVPKFAPQIESDDDDLPPLIGSGWILSLRVATALPLFAKFARLSNHSRSENATTEGQLLPG